MRVTVQGVETADQLLVLAEMPEVDAIQGYLVSEPVPADQVRLVLMYPEPLGAAAA